MAAAVYELFDRVEVCLCSDAGRLNRRFRDRGRRNSGQAGGRRLRVRRMTGRLAGNRAGKIGERLPGRAISRQFGQ
jgi:hypothetical protein